MDFKEVLLCRILRDIKQSYINYVYSGLLIDRQIIWSKIYNCTVSTFSVGGAALTMVNSYFPMATGILVGVATIVKQFFPAIFMSTGDITKLNSLSSDYFMFHHKLLNIYSKLDDKRIAYDDAASSYDAITSEYAYKNSEISKLFGKINKSINSKAIAKCDSYLNEILNLKQENHE